MRHPATAGLIVDTPPTLAKMPGLSAPNAKRGETAPTRYRCQYGPERASRRREILDAITKPVRAHVYVSTAHPVAARRAATNTPQGRAGVSRRPP
jgi:hypothetical protein